VRQTGANKLGVDSGVMRESRAEGEISFVELISQVVLFFKSLGVSANSPVDLGLSTCGENRTASWFHVIEKVP